MCQESKASPGCDNVGLNGSGGSRIPHRPPGPNLTAKASLNSICCPPTMMSDLALQEECESTRLRLRSGPSQIMTRHSLPHPLSALRLTTAMGTLPCWQSSELLASKVHRPRSRLPAVERTVTKSNASSRGSGSTIPRRRVRQATHEPTMPLPRQHARRRTLSEHEMSHFGS